MINWDTLVHAKNHAILGVPAVLRIDDWAEDISLTAIDRTSGISVGDISDTGVETLQPAAAVRVKDLNAAGLNVDDIATGTIEMNGTLWRIIAPAPRPAPTGEGEGELLLLLIKD